MSANPPQTLILPDALSSVCSSTTFFRRVPPGAAVLVTVAALLAVVFRAWGIGAVFETSDQAAMAWMVHFNFGIKWVFAHIYGPVLPVIQRAWVTLMMLLGVPLGESVTRVPVMLISCGQVAATYFLLRRLGRPRAESLLGGACCAVLPALAADAHYPWGDHTVGLFAGTVALWAMLAYLDDRRSRHLATAGLALMAHCLSSLCPFGLPLTLMAAWGFAWGADRKNRERSLTARSVTVGYVLPCAAALAVIIGSHLWTGRGQIGHLLGKRDVQAFGFHADQLIRLPHMWGSQFGWVFGAMTAAGMVYGLIVLRRHARIGLVGLWAWSAFLPFLLFADWDATGYPQYYMFEVVYTAALLAVACFAEWWRRSRRRRAAIGVLAAAGFVQLALGSADVVWGGSLERYTGITTGWGDLRADTGAKAAGWYVREHVPADAIIMTLHTNQGMEAPVAEYYFGRKVLAHYDILPQVVGRLFETMRDDVDVVVADAEQQSLVEASGGFRRVCTVRRDGAAVRFVYAREGLELPEFDGDVFDLNRRYDAKYRPRRVPLALPAAPGFLDALGKYQRAIKELKAVRFADKRG